MLIRSMLAAIAISLTITIPNEAYGERKDALAMNWDLVVELKDGRSVPAAGGKMPVQLRFHNHSDKKQKFTNTEYRISLLDKNGRQMKRALSFTLEYRELILKGRATTDHPGVYVGKAQLKAGEDYFLVVAVRDLVGHIKFTAK